MCVWISNWKTKDSAPKDSKKIEVGPVITEWRVLRFRMEQRPPVWRVAVNILNKQSLRADKGWSSGLGFGARC